jgi:hypothetical protein
MPHFEGKSLLPDGQVFGQITQNRPQKYFLAGKWQITPHIEEIT